MKVAGFAAGEPEESKTPRGTRLVTFSVPVQREKKNDAGAYERVGDTTWVTVTGFGAEADLIVRDVHKGTLVEVEGRGTVRSFKKKSGDPGVAVEVVASVLSVRSRKFEKSDRPAASALVPDVQPAF